MRRARETLLAVLASVAVVVLFVWVQSQAQSPTRYEGDLEVTGNAEVAGNLTVLGAIVGDLDFDLLGNVKGNLEGNIEGNLLGDVMGSVMGDVEGDVKGDLEGDVTGCVFSTVEFEGDLPAAEDYTGWFFRNAVGDTGWVADDDSWVQLWP